MKEKKVGDNPIDEKEKQQMSTFIKKGTNEDR
jgi:hypothetical protein